MPIESMIPANPVMDEAFWRKAAEARVRRFCGWHVAPIATSELVLDGRGGRRLLLPTGRIVSVANVRSDGDDVSGRVRFSNEVGALELDGGSWSRRYGGVTLSLTHGWAPEDVPEVQAIILATAKRSLDGAGLYVQQAIGSASVTYASEGGVPIGAPLMRSEKNELLPYRIAWTTT